MTSPPKKKFVVPIIDDEEDDLSVVGNGNARTNQYKPSSLFKLSKASSDVKGIPSVDSTNSTSLSSSTREASSSTSITPITTSTTTISPLASVKTATSASPSSSASSSCGTSLNSTSTARPTMSRLQARDMCKVYVEKLKAQQQQDQAVDEKISAMQESENGELQKHVATPVSSTEVASKSIISATSCILVNTKQKGNPLLKFVRNVPWQYGDVVADYQINPTICALFLSLRYHRLKPDYIHERLKDLSKSHQLRILLVQVDVKDHHHAVKELSHIALLSGCTLILAWSPEEAGRYLETYKAYENKPPDAIMGKTEKTFIAKATESLTSVRSINKTDVSTLLSTFGTIENIMKASVDDLSLCPGFGPQKARRLHAVFREPFLKTLHSKALGQ